MTKRTRTVYVLTKKRVSKIEVILSINSFSTITHAQKCYLGTARELKNKITNFKQKAISSYKNHSTRTQNDTALNLAFSYKKGRDELVLHPSSISFSETPSNRFRKIDSGHQIGQVKDKEEALDVVSQF